MDNSQYNMKMLVTNFLIVEFNKIQPIKNLTKHEQHRD